MMRFNVIVTFENVDQDIIDIDLPETHYSDEEKFVKTIFDCLEKEDIGELIKFSVCQFANNVDGISWLIERDGKFYFNHYENQDGDTRRWHNFRIDYLQDRVRE